MGIKIYQQDMEEIDWEAMQDDIDLEELEATAREGEVWLLKAKVARLEELLEESEWERERLSRRLQEKEEARMAEEERTERYMKKCDFYMEYSMSVTAEMHGKKKASFLEMAIARKKKKKLTRGVNQEGVIKNMNLKPPNWNQKEIRKNQRTMTTVTKKNQMRIQAWPRGWMAL